MNQTDKHQVLAMLQAAAQVVIDNERLLCELDSQVGDGDHGVTVARGFRAVQNALAAEPEHISDAFTAASTALSTAMGGAIGPIFGSIFKGAAQAAADLETLDLAAWAKVLAAALTKVMRIGGAKPGERTLVDALAPAAQAMEEAARTEMSLPAAFAKAAQAADAGVAQTKQMIAKKGRARFLGEKSLGYQDAGATTMALVIGAMSACVNGQ